MGENNSNLDYYDNIRAIYTAKGAYHNHKETMAHAGLLLLVAILGYVMTAEQWPPCWVDSDLIFFIGISLVLTLVHMFIRWQLIHRRSAAIKFAALEKVLLNDKHNETPNTKNGNDGNDCLTKNNKLCFDLFFPRSEIYYDDIKDYKVNNIEDFIQQLIKNTDAKKGEWLLWFSSIIMILLISWRTSFLYCTSIIILLWGILIFLIYLVKKILKIKKEKK